MGNPKTETNNTDTVVCKATPISSMLPQDYKNLSSSYLFKSEIKTWHCNDSPALSTFYLEVDPLINTYSDSVLDLSWGCLLWGFSLDIASNFIWEENCLQDDLQIVWKVWPNRKPLDSCLYLYDDYYYCYHYYYYW